MRGKIEMMKALGASLVRLFRKSDTSVPPQISSEPGGYSVTLLPAAFGFIPSMQRLDPPWSPPPSPLVSDPPTPRDLDASVHRGSPPSSEPAPSRLGVQPPTDPEIDNASWAWWETSRGTQRVPGWAYCRFANRVGDKAQFAFGYVRDSFGLWEKYFRTCTGFHPDVVEHQQLLTTATHLLSGHSIAVFENLKIAAEACELADRVAAEWATAKETIDLNDAIHRTQQAWDGAGIVPSELSHAHYQDDLLLIMTRSIESVMEGKPERLS